MSILTESYTEFLYNSQIILFSASIDFIIVSLTNSLVYFHDIPFCQFCCQPKFIQAKLENLPPKLLDDYHLTISFVLDLSSKAYLNSANLVCIRF